MFRKLHAHEIEMRVLQVKNTGSQWLLYKDARCDMNILDETVGPGNWQRDHKELKGVIYCGVAINANYKDSSLPKEWVWKWDAGVESNEDKQKGEASDSYKRACTNQGIGRELYTPIFIWVQSDMIPVKDTGIKNSKGKPIYKVDSFENPVVKYVEYNDHGLIKHLIVSHEGKEVFRYPRAFTGGKVSESDREDISQGSVKKAFPEAPVTEAPKKAIPKPAPVQKPNTSVKDSDRFPLCYFTTKFESSSMTDAQLEELLGYDAEHMQQALDYWKSQYPKLKVSYARQDRIKEAIAALQSGKLQASKEPIEEEDYNNEEVDNTEELDDLPF